MGAGRWITAVVLAVEVAQAVIVRPSQGRHLVAAAQQKRQSNLQEVFPIRLRLAVVVPLCQVEMVSAITVLIRALSVELFPLYPLAVVGAQIHIQVTVLAKALVTLEARAEEMALTLERCPRGAGALLAKDTRAELA